jgi:hypothetical protein
MMPNRISGITPRHAKGRPAKDGPASPLPDGQLPTISPNGNRSCTHQSPNNTS